MRIRMAVVGLSLVARPSGCGTLGGAGVGAAAGAIYDITGHNRWSEREETGMKTWLSAPAIVVAGAMLWSGTALGQTTPKPGCDAARAGAPQMVEGQVVSVEPNQGKVTIRSSDGKTHEFQASKESIRDFKVGDKIEARLRNAANC